MHRYEEYEKLYYKKLFFKYFTLFLVFIIILMGTFFIIRYKKNIKKDNSSIKTNNFSKNDIKKNKKPVSINKNINKTDKQEKNIESLHFVLPDISKLDFKKRIVKHKKEKEIKLTKMKEIDLNHTANLGNLKIKIVEKKPQLKILIKKFNNTKDFDLAILISKIYFQKGDLKNAQIWALKANNINPSSYKSWILFANILIKENKIAKAKEILRFYINSYGQNDIIEKKLRSLND